LSDQQRVFTQPDMSRNAAKKALSAEVANETAQAAYESEGWIRSTDVKE